MLEFIQVDKDVDLWTLIAFHFQSFLFQGFLIIVAINTVSSAYLKLITVYPSNLIPGYPSRFRIIVSLYIEIGGLLKASILY